MTNEFHDVVFPSRLAIGIDAAAEFRVDVTLLASGREHRNARWSRPKRRYSLTVGQRPIAEIQTLLSFFRARGGPLSGFLFLDPMNHSTATGASVSAVDVQLGIGDGARTTFALVDQDGRIVTKSIADTLAVAINGVQIFSGFNLNDEGAIEFEAPVNTNDIVSAGFTFHVPVRFENEELVATRTSHGSAEISEFNLLEIYA